MVEQMSAENLPLSGVRVLDIANFLAGPGAGMFLADYGAEVIKVERPDGGDEIRYWGNNKNGIGLFWKVMGRGKKAITIDLRSAIGVDAVKRLVKDVDVVIENYRTGTLEKWGIGYDELSKINPGLIMLSVTGFGAVGPYAGRPGFGTLAEAYSGFVYINGEPDRPPLLPGFGLADSTTALAGAFLVLAALQEKQRSGRGQHIDLAIYDALLTLLGPQVVDYDQLGLIQERSGSRLPFTAPRNTFRTRDGQWVAIAGSAQSTFERICAALEIPHLVEDRLFADNRARLTNAAALDALLQKAIETFDLDDLLERFQKHQATVAPVNNVAQVMADPQVIARENIVAVPDEELDGPIRMQNVIGRFSRTPGRIAHAGPRLGEHNREILIERLGFSADELRAAGIQIDDRPASAASE